MSNIVDTKQLASGFWDKLSADDFSAPLVSIGQATSQKGLPGKFNFSSGENRDAMPGCKLIAVKKTRILYSNKSRSLCGSDDFYHPAPRHPQNFSPDCINCPLQAWDENPMKREVNERFTLGVKNYEKPMCHEAYNLLMVDEKNNPFIISFQKTQLKVVQTKLFTRLKQQFKDYPPFHVAFDMSLQKVQGPGITYYTTVFDNFRPVEKDQADEISAIYAAWKDNFSSVVDRQHQESDERYDRGETAARSFEE